LQEFSGHSQAILSLCPSLDGRFVLSDSCDGTVKLWEATSGSCLYTFQARNPEGRGPAWLSVDACLSADGRYVLSWNEEEGFKLWLLDWELEDTEPSDWVEGARPYLEVFLTLHTPFAGRLPYQGQPTSEQVCEALTRRGKPTWTEKDFQDLLFTLGCAGYGWLRPEGVRRELEWMADSWREPPPLAE
jgi:WD40 repeat protein